MLYVSPKERVLRKCHAASLVQITTPPLPRC
jgi:hypothetical protein